MNRPLLSVLLIAGLALPHASAAPDAADVAGSSPPAADAASLDAVGTPSAPGAAAFLRGGRPGRRPSTRPGTGTGNGQLPGGSMPGSQQGALDPWLAGELRHADQLLLQGHLWQARDRLTQVRMVLERQYDPRYRRIAMDVRQVEYAIQQSNVTLARRVLHQVLRQLGSGQQTVRDRVIRDLEEAIRLLRAQQGHTARRFTLRAYNLAIRAHGDLVLRQQADGIRRADLHVAQGRFRQAVGALRNVLRRLRGQDGGSPGPGCQSDRLNRREWRRDIYDLIDTIQDGNIRMAQRDLQTLIRDIRQDGHDWSCNQPWVQRLQFVGQRLTWGHQEWAVEQLWELREDLNF